MRSRMANAVRRGCWTQDRKTRWSMAGPGPRSGQRALPEDPPDAGDERQEIGGLDAEPLGDGEPGVGEGLEAALVAEHAEDLGALHLWPRGAGLGEGARQQRGGDATAAVRRDAVHGL